MARNLAGADATLRDKGHATLTGSTATSRSRSTANPSAYRADGGESRNSAGTGEKPVDAHTRPPVTGRQKWPVSFRCLVGSTSSVGRSAWTGLRDQSAVPIGSLPLTSTAHP
jgi:hypothetical protein